MGRDTECEVGLLYKLGKVWHGLAKEGREWRHFWTDFKVLAMGVKEKDYVLKKRLCEVNEHFGHKAPNY